MVGVSRGGTSASTKDAWLQTGYAVLAEDGVRAVKIDVLTKRLGVTKGSFYWHFTDMAAFKAALVSNWARWRDDDHQRFARMAELPPRDRLLKMMAFLVSPRYWTLERAMREWARSDTTAAASVRAADRRALRAVRQAFVDFGFDDRTASRRAEWTMAMGVGALHLSPSRQPRISAAAREELVDFMLRA